MLIIIVLVVMEDYIRFNLEMLELTPDILFLSPQFSTSFAASIAGLALIQPDINFISLNFIRAVVSHECLFVRQGETQPPNFPLYAQAIRDAFARQGLQLLGFLLSGLISDFDEECCPIAIVLLRIIAEIWPTQLLTWLPSVAQQFPSSIPTDVREHFVNNVTR